MPVEASASCENSAAPLVSIIVPCFNQGRYLPDAIDSVISQTWPRWECIIIDDGSTDDTAAVAARLAARDSRVRCVSQPNRGLAGARNRGLDEARGEYIQFLDADDLLVPEKLEAQLAAACAEERLQPGPSRPAVVYCRPVFRVDDDTAVAAAADMPFMTLERARPRYSLAARWENGLSIPCQAFLFDARLFRDPPLRFDETLPNHEDWECWMRVFAREHVLFFVDRELVVYRRHEAAMSRNAGRMTEGWLAALRTQYALNRYDPVLRSVLAKRIREAERELRRLRGLSLHPAAGSGAGGILARVLRPLLGAERVERLRRFLRREPALSAPAPPRIISTRLGHRLANGLRRFFSETTVRRIRRFLRRNPDL